MTDQGLRRLSDNTTAWRGPRNNKLIERNLGHIAGKPCATLIGRPLEGQTVAVVGSGPSLSRNVEGLRDKQILACNSALPVLHRHGISATLALTAENVPNPFHLQHDNWQWLVADIASAPEAFDRADLWFIGSSGHLGSLVSALGVPQLASGGAVGSAAVSLALHLGAAEVVLVGCDLSYDMDTGATYAEGARWEGWRVHRDGDTLRFEGGEDREQVRDEAGQPRVPRKQAVREVPSWDGEGTVCTDVILDSQRVWFEQAARRCPIANATEGGAMVEGAPEVPLGDCYLSPADRLRFDPLAAMVDPRAVVDQAAREAERGRALAAAMEAESPDPDTVAKAATEPQDWVGGWAATQVAQMRQVGLPPHVMLRAIYECWRAAAERADQMGELLGKEIDT